MKKKIYGDLYIHADNVHVSGGKLLLDALLSSTNAKTCKIQLDSRMDLKCIQSSQSVRLIRPTILCRLAAQLWLRKKVQISDTVLCFGNLPPLFRIKGRVVVFLQNRFLIENMPASKFFTLKVYVHLIIERLWFRYCLRNANQFLVQTKSMKLSLEEYFLRLSINHDKKIKINISTFIDPHIMDNFIYPRNLNNSTKEFDFIYPASGEPYKNHNNLIDALIILAGENIYPSIVITLDEKKYSKLLARLYAEKEKHKLNLHNVGFIPHNKILELYEATSHLIYPSFNESLGLPLIEAAKLGMPVVAGELDYIRDTVKPENTFDPNSPISISRAIKRQLGIDIEVTKIIGADDFLSSIQAHHNF